MAMESVIFDLRDTFKAPLAALKMPASKKGVGLAIRVDPNVPLLVQENPNRLRQVLINLVGNAIKFIEAGSVDIQIRLEDDEAKVEAGQRLHFSVSDTGVGIPAEKLDLIFDSSVQADGSITRKYGGTGLGLTISREPVTMMGGRIWAESVAGQGSIFHFTADLIASVEARR